MVLAIMAKNDAALNHDVAPKKEQIFSIMEELLKMRPKTFIKPGDLIEGTVLEKDGAKIYLDLGIFGTGIIYGKEYQNARDLIKNLEPGAVITAKIVETENEDGLAELSLKEAGAEIAWKEIKDIKELGETVDLRVSDSNKGGLVIEFKGVKGFLPASQLSASHYPRVEGGDKELISGELKKLVGQTLSVTILDTDQKAEKLIFSEKASESGDVKKLIEKYKVGDVIEGEITGVVEFGVFIRLEEGLEGLAHISELDWALVESTANLFKVEDKVKAKIIAIDGDKLSLSIKALKADPWEIGREKHKKGDIVRGKILRLNKFGALVLLDTGVYGLTHISEFGTEKKMREMVEANKEYMFQIMVFQPENRKLSMSFLGKDGELATKKTDEVAKVDGAEKPADGSGVA